MANKKFPTPCSRCGMCCLSCTCEIGQKLFDVAKDDPCPAFTVYGDGGLAQCRLPKHLHHLVGIGEGCCIKARAVDGRTGVERNFSELNHEQKRLAVIGILNNRYALRKGWVKNGKKKAVY